MTVVMKEGRECDFCREFILPDKDGEYQGIETCKVCGQDVCVNCKREIAVFQMTPTVGFLSGDAKIDLCERCRGEMVGVSAREFEGWVKSVCRVSLESKGELNRIDTLAEKDEEILGK